MNRIEAGKVALVLGGALIGSTATYFIVRKDLSVKFAKIAEEEIASVKESYDLLHKQGPYSDPKKASEAMKAKVEETQIYDDLLDENGYFKEEAYEETMPKPSPELPPLPDGRPDPKTVVEDILDERKDPPRHEDTHTPYVITANEFMQDNEHYDKITVEYYEFDNTLASEDESMIKDHEKLLGGDFQNYVGWKSDSDHVVYVRNERISSDFEVLFHEGGYEQEVLGILPDDHPKKKMLQMRNDE